MPLPLDLLASFWKGLVGQPLDPEHDLQDADLLTYNYVKKFESVGRPTAAAASATVSLGDSVSRTG